MLKSISEHASFGGTQGFYRHHSKEIGLPMRFSVYQPPQAKYGPVPVLFYLAGLTCTEETFPIKGGSQRLASQLGIMLVSPDTSPRQAGIAGEDDSWDFGSGAGFYIDATREPWSKHYRMESYLVEELRQLIMQEFPARADKVGIFGHSMGGHGALTLALRHPALFHSVSAFAPVCAPMRCPWGQKAFSNYLGPDQDSWSQHDASELMLRSSTPFPQGILIDQGINDPFLTVQLMPHAFEAACHAAQQPLTLRRHAVYDHNYYFISTFMDDHLTFHADNLR